MTRKAHPSDVSDEEWTLIAPYLTLIKGDELQRKHDPSALLRASLREVFNGLRWSVRTGAQ